jgi:hypothetical protein
MKHKILKFGVNILAALCWMHINLKFGTGYAYLVDQGAYLFDAVQTKFSKNYLFIVSNYTHASIR